MLDSICKILSNINDEKEVKTFFEELLTDNEISTLSKRWRILNMLLDGATQREIAKELNVSLCKITRGAKILNNEKSICKKLLIKENKNVNRRTKRK